MKSIQSDHHENIEYNISTNIVLTENTPTKTQIASTKVYPGSFTFISVTSFFPCTDTFPAVAVGFDGLAVSTLGTSALTVVVAVAL